MKAVRFSNTRRAIGRIRQRNLRDDFLGVLDGVEFYANNRRKPAALKCAIALSAMSVGLNRTISPRVTVAILDGLLKDAPQDAVLARIRNTINTHNDMHCKIEAGTPIGSSKCAPKRNSTCYTISGASGCGGTSGFHFPWSAEVLAAVAAVRRPARPSRGLRSR